MGLEIIENSRKKYVECTCDTCGASVDVGAKIAQKRVRGKSGVVRGAEITNVVSVQQQLKKQGWRATKHVLKCDKCVSEEIEKMKAQGSIQVKTKPAANIDEVRQPTREQKREIIGMLDTVYDTEKGHYKGTNSDQSVAEEIGNGVMWGWVKEIRVDMYGDGDENEAAAQALGEARQWMEDAEKRAADINLGITQLQLQLKELNDIHAEIRKLVGMKK